MASERHSGAVPVPYSYRISDYLWSGRSFLVHGTTEPNSERFAINLLLGEGNSRNIAMHLNVRFHEDAIVMNALQDEEWGEEERVSNPFRRGEKFEIKIVIQMRYFDIFANGAKVHEFKHRLPLNSIEFIEIVGDCILYGVYRCEREIKVPFEYSFVCDSFKNDELIFFSGIPKGGFRFNLSDWKGDTLFHFNPRLNERQIVRNSKKNDRWENEERDGHFPFRENVPFDLVFHNRPHAIEVYFDGDYLLSFAHRCQNPAKDYTKISIDGDVEVIAFDRTGLKN
ncbi:hypothetical protein AB6A40_009589 [Gnathostoma spinigerum]|uniref:Galectin n=1 Tax=Gnathostoma spinigerum TaxID=75299 RepID=A0ABD6ESE3_9BILA